MNDQIGKTKLASMICSLPRNLLSIVSFCFFPNSGLNIENKNFIKSFFLFRTTSKKYESVVDLIKVKGVIRASLRQLTFLLNSLPLKGSKRKSPKIVEIIAIIFGSTETSKEKKRIIGCLDHRVPPSS